MSGWKTLRVIVEVPVRGDYSEKDMLWDLRGHIDIAAFERKLNASALADVGRVNLKQFNMVMAALKRKGAT